MSMFAKAAVAAALVSFVAPQAADARPLRHKTSAHKAGHASRVGHYPRRAPRYAYGRPPYAPASDDGPYGPTSADPYPPTAADDPYNPYAPPGAAIRAMARRNQYAPGVTNELAPDNIATASGGPSGGVPGFSGR